MGIFSRFMDIVNANINALLDKAEDPEKMVRLMLQEVEDTLIELKASCAGEMAKQATAERHLKEVEDLIERWLQRAELALSKEREDLAREALLEKHRCQADLEELKAEITIYTKGVAKCKEDITKLEEKLAALRVKHKNIVERSREREKVKESREDLQRASNERFEQMEQQIDRMEANAFGERAAHDLEKKFFDLEQMDEVEAELEELKKRRKEK
ncbi:MAG: phage shock protein A [Spirochaetales bacterium]|nr:phage shock protein A [Spirochaetales bacterium]